MDGIGRGFIGMKGVVWDWKGLDGIGNWFDAIGWNWTDLDGIARDWMELGRIGWSWKGLEVV